MAKGYQEMKPMSRALRPGGAGQVDPGQEIKPLTLGGLKGPSSPKGPKAPTQIGKGVAMAKPPPIAKMPPAPKGPPQTKPPGMPKVPKFR